MSRSPLERGPPSWGLEWRQIVHQAVWFLYCPFLCPQSCQNPLELFSRGLYLDLEPRNYHSVKQIFLKQWIVKSHLKKEISRVIKISAKGNSLMAQESNLPDFFPFFSILFEGNTFMGWLEKWPGPNSFRFFLNQLVFGVWVPESRRLWLSPKEATDLREPTLPWWVCSTWFKGPSCWLSACLLPSALICKWPGAHPCQSRGGLPAESVYIQGLAWFKIEMGSQPKSTEVEEETGKSPAAAQTHRPFYPLQKLLLLENWGNSIQAANCTFCLFVCLKNHNLNLEGV